MKIQLIYSLSMCLFMFCAQAEQAVTVINDHNEGIFSSIYYLSLDKDNLKGHTNQKGIFVAKEECQPNTYVIAKPKSFLYESGKLICDKANEMVVKVTKTVIYTTLVKNRDTLTARGDYAGAALASNEIAARSVDTKISSKESALTIKLMGKYLKLPAGAVTVLYDPQQNSEVATIELINAVKVFQNENNIPVSGSIDYKTLSEAAGREVGTIMFQEVR